MARSIKKKRFRLKDYKYVIFFIVMALIAGLTYYFVGNPVSYLSRASKPDINENCIEAFTKTKGLGTACKHKNGLYKVLLENGETILTHGPDTEEKISHQKEEELVPPAIVATYKCVPDTEPHVELLYAAPSDKPNNYLLNVDKIKNQFITNQNILAQEAAQFGVSSSFKVKCNPDGTPYVGSVKLTTVNSTSGDFGAIVSNLKALGYNSSAAKYNVYYDVSSPSLCGVAGFYGDDSPGRNNNNNTQGGYAVVWACEYGMLHELMHTMGAVQLSAPNSSGGWHCNDGEDWICYPDGGSTSNYNSTICASKHLDCNNNDYFHPKPAIGSYLSTHWNIASCNNDFIYRPDCAYPTATPIPTATPRPTFTPTPVPGDISPPTVTITYPQNGMTVTRNSTIGITVNALDNIGISRVVFSVNGSVLCTDNTAPFLCSWKVSGKPNANYTVSAKAYDLSSNTATNTITVKSR